MIGIGLDDLPKVANENPQILDVLSHTAAPDLLQQLVVRDHQADMGREHVQKTVLLAGQLDLVVVEQHGPADEIDRQRAGDHDGVLVRALEIPSERRMAACDQFGHAERLDDVVIGSRLEKADFFLLVGFDREDDDRDIGP